MNDFLKWNVGLSTRVIWFLELLLGTYHVLVSKMKREKYNLGLALAFKEHIVIVKTDM
jgi:hypothetical protein